METEVPLVYMVMRTNRRIIQNAMTCLDDIKSGRVTENDEQAIVYQWMMMKPFFPTDELSLSRLKQMLTQQQSRKPVKIFRLPLINKLVK